jgi:RimJ/RimL family protein N-acetyltransferase
MSLLPTFRTRRLVVRELVPTDIPAYRANFINYQVIRQLTSAVPWPYPENGVEDYLQSEIFPHQGQGKWVWAIALEESEAELIGAVELIRHANPANRGFWLGERYWGRGYMTEAVEPINEYAFTILGFESLIFANAVGNSRSSRIKEKTGARFLRREPGSYVDPDLKEREIFELTRDDWLARYGLKEA